MFRRDVITEAELDQIHLDFGTDLLLPYRATTSHFSRRTPAFVKQPDAAIGLNDNGECLFPRAIFQVGFSQDYAEILDDVHQWLERSEGGIPLVVLMFIEKHSISDPIDASDAHPDDDADSDAEMYQRFRDTCDVDRYVGPPSAFAERYPLGPAGMYRVDSRIVSTPREIPHLHAPLIPVEYYLATEWSICSVGAYVAEYH